MLEADLGQAAVAGPADPGDVQGLVDGALDPGAQGVLRPPGLGALLGAGRGDGLVQFLRAQGELTVAPGCGRALVLEGAVSAVGAAELHDDGFTAPLVGGTPVEAGLAGGAAGLAGFPVHAKGTFVEAVLGFGLG
ncbi:hypothetical protein GCM10018966_026540 [Streptomyces yanii]